jgi:hypothetical protein
MRTQDLQVTRSRAVRPIAAVIAAAASCGAWAAEGDPYYIGVNQAFTKDSNVFRIPDGPGDLYSTTSLLGGFDQTYGRQRVRANANVGYNKYRDEPQAAPTPNPNILNHTSYVVDAAWDWATIEKLSGSFSANANQGLATVNNNTNSNLPIAERNILNANQVRADLRYGGDGQMSLESYLSHGRVRYSSPDYFDDEATGNTGSLGAFFRPGAFTKVGVAMRFTRTVSPYAIPPTATTDYQSNTEDTRNVDLTIDWRSTAQTNVFARLSWTRLTSYPLEGRDTSGLSGVISANYAPTAKLTFNASASYEPGTYTSYFSSTGSTPGTPVSNLASSSETTTSFGFGVAYAATAKVALNAGVRYSNAAYLNTQTVGGATASTEFNDVYTNGFIGATYAMTRNWQFACNLGREVRDVSGSSGFEYTANTASCSVGYTYR